MTPDFSAPIRDWLPTCIYPGHRTGMPDVVMARWPDVFGRTGPGRWKTWICETPRELRDVLARLGEPVPITAGALDFRAGPDGALMRRAAGMAPVGEIVVGLYPPPAEGWPWLVLLSVPTLDPDAERGRYTWEALDSEAAALDHMARMARQAPAHILAPERRT